jgi:mono/diheme cytochrome c family protein
MSMQSWTRFLAALSLVMLLASCGSGDGGEAEKKTQTPAERAVALDDGPRAVKTLKIDGTLADQGEILFEEKSCSDCHTLGEADIAPDLAGVLDRRTQQWLKMQITNPEWMNQNDTITKGLIDEFDLEMVTEEVSEAEAEAILQYLLREDRDNKENSK